MAKQLPQRNEDRIQRLEQQLAMFRAQQSFDRRLNDIVNRPAGVSGHDGSTVGAAVPLGQVLVEWARTR